jgi:hypothetical protein
MPPVAATAAIAPAPCKTFLRSIINAPFGVEIIIQVCS